MARGSHLLIWERSLAICWKILVFVNVGRRMCPSAELGAPNPRSCPWQQIAV